MKTFFQVSPLRGIFRRSVLALAALSLIGAGGASPSRYEVPTNDRVLLKGIPYVAQQPNYCGPAALSSIFSYWGKTVSQQTIGQRTYDRRQGATNGADLLLYAREEGFSAYTHLSSVKELKAHLRNGMPVMVLQEMSLDDPRGHFRTVIGYNDRTRQFFMRDTNYEEIRTLSFEDFEKTWAAFGRWALIVCPKERETQLGASVRSNPVLHLDLGQARLRRRQTRLAREHFVMTLRLEPGNAEAIDQLGLLDEMESPS